MANKRNLKRIVNHVCSELLAECLAISLYNETTDKDDAQTLIKSIIMIHSDYISRISHPEPGLSQTAYYGDLIKEFNKSVSEIIDHIGNIH